MHIFVIIVVPRYNKLLIRQHGAVFFCGVKETFLNVPVALTKNLFEAINANSFSKVGTSLPLDLYDLY